MEKNTRDKLILWIEIKIEHFSAGFMSKRQTTPTYEIHIVTYKSTARTYIPIRVIGFFFPFEVPCGCSGNSHELT